MSTSDASVSKLVLVLGSHPSTSPPSAPPPGSKVTFHFRTCIADASTQSSSPDATSSWPPGDYMNAPAIDDSKNGGVPMELLLGKQFKMPILEQCVTSMRVGEVSQFTLHKSLVTSYPFVAQAFRKHVKSVKRRQNGSSAFDDDNEPPAHRCCGMNVPSTTGHPDLDKLMKRPSDLVFTIELLSIETPDSYEKEIWQMNDEEKVNAIPVLKQQGNDLCSAGKYEEAEKKYGKALAIIDHLQMKEKPGESEWIQFDTIKIPILSNFALCKLHLEQYYEAIRHASKVIELDPNNVKCYFRRGKANIPVWNLEEARKDFAQALSLDPSLKTTIQKELQRIDQLESEKKKEEATRLAGKLFK